MPTESFNILCRFTSKVLFAASIECAADAAYGFKLGLAVKAAVIARADLVDANLAGAKRTELAIARTRILAEGAIVGWKKCQNDVIVKLTVPAEAKRSHAFGRKCRAEYADVIEVIGAKTGTSLYDGKTKYTPGSRVTCDTWCDDWRIECGGGIHFYITREEAEAHS